ncbi:concanavalin A-like lectin/glucanase domain-containing protein [Tuber borchii]|uniref:Concanavalin A-like lectin/glucanase domain-containing protein n=1 Tax=Tuber borchii TaxID=42251 RepID=A0A2T6ZB11_TUBBO|nr:concanavalin A-like lectin/glucanase domain-containing protein [Tuber borchii]
MHTDFSAIPDTTNVTTVLPDWDVQTWAFDADPSTGVIARQNEAENVWIKDGKLHLRQKGYKKGDKGPVSVAEIHSKRTDFNHGSFRAKYQVTVDKKADGGAVAGFFFYYDDDDETDIEILTKDGDKAIRYTQHPAYDNVTDSAIPDATFQLKLKKSWTKMQEHRFDWTSSVTTFFQDNSVMKEMTKNVPKHEGKAMINLWANNGSWSGPPSTNDVEMKMEYILIYFNTSASQSGNDEDFNSVCKGAGGPKNGTVCWINDKSGVDSEDSKVTLSSADSILRSQNLVLVAGVGLAAMLLVWT